MDKADELIEAIDRWGRHRYHVAWDERDVITYAIASGADLDDLPLLWEQAPLQVLPSFVTRLGGTSIRDFVEPVIPLGLMAAASRMTVETFGEVPYRCEGADSVATARVVERDERRVLAEILVESSIGGSPLARTVIEMHFRLPRAESKAAHLQSTNPAPDGPAGNDPTRIDPARIDPALGDESHWVSETTDPVRPHQSAAFRLLQGVRVGVELPDGMHIDPATSRSMGLGEASLQGEAMLAVACRNAGRVVGLGRYGSIRRISARLSGRIDLVEELTFRSSELTEGRAVFEMRNSRGRVVLGDGEVEFAGDQ